MKPNVAILIVNWNGWEDTLKCLESALRLAPSASRIVVIDNGSRNDSVARIRNWAAGARCAESALSVPVTLVSYDRETAERGGSADGERIMAGSVGHGVVLIQTGANLGFAGGNNVGIRYARMQGADYILLLNNDAFFRSSDALGVMVEFMESTQRAGACGGRLFYPDGSPQQSYGNFPALPRILACLFPLHLLFPPRWLKGLKRSNVVPEDWVSEPLAVDWPSGACLMVRSDAIAEVGLLDEHYFLYMEETDWCLRMSKQGWKRYYVPQAEVVHAFGGSVGTTSTSMRMYHLESQFAYYRKHFSRPALALVAAGFLLRSSFTLGMSRLSSSVGPASPSDELQYWHRARLLAAAAMREILPRRPGNPVRTTADPAVRCS